MQRNRLINRPQLVKSICPQRTDAQAQVDFRKRWNGHWHERIDLITNRVARTFLSERPCPTLRIAFTPSRLIEVKSLNRPEAQICSLASTALP